MKRVSDENGRDGENLKKIQESTLSLLKAFDSVCKREQIPYYIMGGTLLGAVRHKGFIPWDDDADVALFREDYLRLEKVLVENPPPGTYWESVSNPEHCPSNHFFGKLCLIETDIVDRNAVKGSVSHHFGIDVFPLDVRPKGFLRRQRQRFLSYYYNHLSPLLFGGTSRNHTLIKAVARRLLSPFYGSLSEVVERFYAVAECKGNERSEYRISLCGRYGYNNESYEESWFSQTVELEFEDTHLPAAAQWRRILEKTYGKDWHVPRRDNASQSHYCVR
jgi:lipopolysaccharide cholinephosphotransferase